MFLKGIQSILHGELWVSRELLSECVMGDMKPNPTTGMRLNRDTDQVLSRRETEILGMVSIGAKNEEIANELCISPHTVKTHLYNIYKKIHVADRLQAVLWAAKNLK
jgi:ATP/maltotriose-dependent transcriptional regulator MalT